MRAARYHGKGDVRVEQVPEGIVGPGQIKIVPAYVGICGSDLHEYLGGPTYTPATPHPVTGEQLPITLGHEISGVIKEIGTDVVGFQVGQKVVIEPLINCSTCLPCQAGIENVCRNVEFIGLSKTGGLSDSVIVPSNTVVALPDNVPLDVGALVEPLSVAWHAVSIAGNVISPGATALVLGGGPIGLAIIQCLVAKKVGTILVSEVAKQRQKFALEYGAHYILDPTTCDVSKKSQELSRDGEGPDIVFDCAGVPATLKTACLTVKTHGIIVNVAVWEKEVPFQPNWINAKECRYTSARGYLREEFEAVIHELSCGNLKPHGMITGRIQLENIVEEGLKPLIYEKDKNVKILVQMAPLSRSQC